jgi:hypothetical protein
LPVVSWCFAAYWFYLRFAVNPATLGVIFFLGKHLHRHFGASGDQARRARGPHQNHGLHASPFEHCPDSRTADAKSPAGRSRSSCAIQHQPNGCAHAAVLHNGCGEQGKRSAAAGITGVARTTGAAISPLFVGFMFARPSWINVPFFFPDALKILYDLLLYKEFVAIQPPEER